MKSLQLLDLFGSYRLSCFSQQRIGEQSTAHPDAAMNAPHCQFDAAALQCLAPRQHVLINTVDKRTVQIEQHRRSALVRPAFCFLRHRARSAKEMLVVAEEICWWGFPNSQRR